ncbi:DUF106 domain-containing protein [Candidatus Woesearchaeota archaeon]|nr:DUF106 domain-containing protein [Candidatus Woesearchaeota archaeon]
MVFDNLLDPIFGPLLNLEPFFAIFLIAFVITIGITIIYKYATDQERMKELKKKIKGFQDKMKKEKDNPEKVMKLQKEAMQYNMEMMKHSFKPTLYTFLPIIIIFGWLNAHMAYYGLPPGEEFELTAMFQEGVDTATITVIPEGVAVNQDTQPVIDGKATWMLNGPAGTYKATIDSGTDFVEKKFIITAERRYEAPLQTYKDSSVMSVSLSNAAVKPLGSITLFGWRPGWLGTYILLSIALSIVSRKILGVA